MNTCRYQCYAFTYAAVHRPGIKITAFINIQNVPPFRLLTHAAYVSLSNETNHLIRSYSRVRRITEPRLERLSSWIDFKIRHNNMINVVLEIWLTKLDIRDLYFFLSVPYVIIVDISFTEEIGGWLNCVVQLFWWCFGWYLGAIVFKFSGSFPAGYYDVSHCVWCVGNFFLC